MAESGKSTRVFQEGWTALRENPILAVPSLVALLIVALLNLLLMGSAMGVMGRPGLGMGSLGAFAGTAVLSIGLSILLSMLAGGMTVAMAHDALAGGSPSLGAGLAATQRRLGDLVVASILASVVLVVGFMLFFVPGLVAAFFLLFTLPAVMVGGVGGVASLGASVRLVSARLGETVILAVGLLVIGLVVGVVGMLFRFVPVLGFLVALILQAALAGYASAAIVAAYRRAEHR